MDSNKRGRGDNIYTDETHQKFDNDMEQRNEEKDAEKYRIQSCFRRWEDTKIR